MTPADQPIPPSTAARGLRWFAFLGGAVAWFAHLAAIFLISEFGCVAGLGERYWASVSLVPLLLLGASVIPLIVAITAALVGFHHRRGADPRVDWLARAGWLFSALFAVIIAVQSIPALFYLHGC